MLGRQRPRSVLRKSEGAAEGGPILGTVQIGVFDHGDGLSRARDPFGEQRIEVIDRRQIGRDHRPGLVPLAGKRILRTAHLMRPEIVQRDDARDGRRQRRRNLRIAEVGDMMHALDAQIVNGGVERARTWPAVPEKSITMPFG